MQKVLLVVLAVLAFAYAQDEPAATTAEEPVIQELGMARLLTSKFLLSQYAVEDKEVVVDYRIYNVGDKDVPGPNKDRTRRVLAEPPRQTSRTTSPPPTLQPVFYLTVGMKVSLDDRHSFPTSHFDIVRGLLQVRWERLAPGANVSHSVVVKPRYSGTVNYTSAIVHYLPAEDANEPRIAYSTAPGEGYIYRLKDYERKFGTHYADWAIFALMALPCLALPYLLWYRTKSRYETQSKKQK